MTYNQIKVYVFEHVRCQVCADCGELVVLGRYDLKTVLCWKCARKAFPGAGRVVYE